MSASFFPQGEIQVYVRCRSIPIFYTLPSRPGVRPGEVILADVEVFEYLGTAVVSPQVRATMVYRPINSDRLETSYNKMIGSEQHLVSTLLNRVNHETWNKIKTPGTAPQTTDVVRDVPAGKLVIGSTDFELFLKYALMEGASPFRPTGAPRGRLYHSAVVLNYDEDSPSRVQELGLIVECNPLPKDHRLKLYTERDSDLPTVTAE